MSITLISGSLGTGKTALAVKLLTEHSYYPDNAVVIGVREWQGGGAYYNLKSMQDATSNQAMIEEIGGLSGTVYLVDEAKRYGRHGLQENRYPSSSILILQNRVQLHRIGL